MHISRRIHRRALVTATSLAVLAAGALTATAATASPTPSGSGGSDPAAAVGVHYAVPNPACGRVARGRAQCFAMSRKLATKGTPGARAYVVAPSRTPGPSGGYTPTDLTTVYSLDPNGGAGQTVGIIDAWDDPYIKADLSAFDTQYHLPGETATSLRVVNQRGKASPLPQVAGAPSSPPASQGWSEEETLDVQAVRALCHLCKILLVETDTNSFLDLTTGLATAVRLGATVVSNSYGGPEAFNSAGALQALKTLYNFPRVPILASTGDDGWYSWEFVNYYRTNNCVTPDVGDCSSASSPEIPAALPNVVAIGGTTLQLNSDSSRQSETVWNNNGPNDVNTGPYAFGGREGASGGGCSTTFAAAPWQATVANYAAMGCGTKRLAADVSALANWNTGFDIRDSSPYDSGDFNGQHWGTFGGTSLASPLVAAMWALAGGSKGVAYPAQTLYDHLANDSTSSFFDVASGGNDYCDGDVGCRALSGVLSPNTFIDTSDGGSRPWGWVDCSSDLAGVLLTGHDGQCEATSGYDGPSGVGVPTGVAGLVSPVGAKLTRPASLALHKPAAFTGANTGTPIAGDVVTLTWKWGDGTANTAGPSVAHTFNKAGTYTVTLTVADAFGTASLATTKVTVGKPAVLKLTEPNTLKVHKTGSFTAKATDPNTGGKILSYTWSWGDRKAASHGAHTTHKFSKVGTYVVTLTVKDNGGVLTKKTHKVKVTR